MASNVMFDRKWKIVLQTIAVNGKTSTVKDEHEIKDLKVTFNITNTLLGDPSLATFQIFNINERSVSFLRSHNCYITFYAGYFTETEESWNVLFSGEVTNSYGIRQGVDIIWNVWARNAFSLLDNTNPTLEPIQTPTALRNVFESLVADAPGIKGKPTYVNKCGSKLDDFGDLDEYTVEGTFKAEFDDLLNMIGLGWEIDGDEMIVYDQEFTDPSSDESIAMKVSRETGLLTIPTVDYTGVKFTHLLNGRFRPSKIIEIEPNTVRYNLGNEFYVKKFDQTKWRAQGRFRIYEVIHRGDTRGDRWETNVTAFYRRN